MFVFPPYAGMDTESEGRVHAFLGYYPFWDPPTPEDVFHALRQRFPELEELGAGANDVDSKRLSSFSPLFNRVRLVFNLVFVGMGTGLLLVLLRGQKK
jgi:hypothetical protein